MDNKTKQQQEEPMTDAMGFSTRALQEKQAEEAEKRRAAAARQAAQKAAAQPRKQPDDSSADEPPHKSHKRKWMGLKKQKQKRRKEKEFVEEQDPYYGLKLKPIEEYQRQYEQTLSFQPVKPEDHPDEMTGTFSYLFNGSQADQDDPELQKKLQKLHEERRRRVNRVVQETGAQDVAKEDIFSITTAVSLDEIRKAAAKKGVKIAPPRSVQNEKEPQKAPVQEPVPVRETPQKETAAPAVKEPPQRPVPPRAVQPAPTVRVGKPVQYRPAGTPVHTIPLQDLTTPLFNEARSYPQPVEDAAPQPTGSAAPQETPPAYRSNITPLPSSPAIQPAAEQKESHTDQPAGKTAASVLPFTHPQAPADAEAEPEPSAPQQPSAAQVPDRFTNDSPKPAEKSSGSTQKPAEPEDADNGKPQATYRHLTGAARATVREVEEPAQPQPAKRRILHRKPAAEAEPQAPAQSPLKQMLFGTADDEKPEAQELPPVQKAPEPDDEELEDYRSPKDAASIFHQLGSDMRELMLRLTVTGICGLLMLFLGAFGEYGLFGIPPLNITVYLIANFIFLAFSVGFCGVTVFNGIKALFKLRANADSGVAVASIIGVIQSILALFNQTAFAHGQLHLYSTLVCAALFFNTFGKFLLVHRVNKNFHYVTSPNKKYAVDLFDDHNTALQMAEGVTMDTPQIAYQRKADFLQNFLRLSYSDDPSDRSSQFLAPILFCASLVLFLVMLLLIQPYDVAGAFTAFAAATCVSVPMMNMLSVNLPLSRLSKVATQCGGMVIGFPAVQHFADANAVLVDAKDLFPRGSVILNGIKTFGNAQMDDAILAAAALMNTAQGPMSNLFSQIVHSRRNALPKVENVQYEDGLGLSGWVGGKRVFIGNRRLMEHHSITPPKKELEARYLQGGKQIAYLSVSGELLAMFIVTYRADRHRTLELQRMEDNGISLLVRSNDPIVTAPFLATLFGLDSHTVRVLPDRLGQVYEALVKKPAAGANALLATGGKPCTMMRLITACARQYSNISIAVALQNVGAVLGFVLVAFLSCQKGIQQINTLSLLLYEAFWVLAIWLVPKLRRP